MRPTDKPKYSPPSLRRFASEDELLGHFAARGSPAGFAAALQFVADGKGQLEKTTTRPKKLAHRR